MIRNSPKTLPWLIKLAFFTLFPASIKTVYRVQNCIPKMVIHRLLWASNSKSTFITKFEYWREFSYKPCTHSWSHGKRLSHFNDNRVQKLLTRALTYLPLLLSKKVFFFFQLTTTRIIFALKFHLLVKTLFISIKFWKNKESNYYARHKNLVQNSICSNFIVWFP